MARVMRGDDSPLGGHRMTDRPATHRRPAGSTLGIALAILTVTLLASPLEAQQAADSSAAFRDSIAVRQKAIEAGRHVFHGEGTCFGCHGPNLEGTAIAPTLRAHKWRNGDGSLDMIIHVVRNGVPKTAMISHPGGINDSELLEVATYVWAVSRGAAKP
jgi:mono/diheme cytochrome c family protein